MCKINIRNAPQIFWGFFLYVNLLMNMKLNRLVIVVFVLITSAYAQEVIGNGLAGNQLFNFLVDNYKPSTILGYNSARDTLYLRIDRQEGDVKCVYTEFALNLPNGVDPSSYLYNNGSGIDCEHVWPQSMYDEDGVAGNPMKSDMHHLRPAKSNVNSSRGNKPYNDIADQYTNTWYWLSYQQSNIPTSNIDRYSESGSSYFEPRESVKGDLARSVFYFYTMYKDVANQSFFASQINTIREWHSTDPPDEEEIERTIRIAAYQDNLANPYIIDPTLVERVFFPEDLISVGDINNDGVLNVLDVVIAINMIISGQEPTQNDVDILDFNDDGVINILDIVQLINIIILVGE